jgi:MoaA/NifB/PqqE/SkfB family radical SAM enzyme
MYWNVHVDGLEFTHDLIVEREGVFKECVEAIKMAKILGYQVATNTTVYKETDVAEIEDMFKFLSPRSKWTATRFRPATITTRRRRTWFRASASEPEDFFLTRG